MDPIKECFNEHDGVLIKQLNVVGFSDFRARQFLPEAESGILDSTRDTDVDQITKELVSGAPSKFLCSVNVSVIAEKLGITSDQVTRGLAAITPVLAQELSQQSDCVFGALTSFAPGLFKRFS